MPPGATGGRRPAQATPNAIQERARRAPPPVFEDWETPIYQRVSAGLAARRRLRSRSPQDRESTATSCRRLRRRVRRSRPSPGHTEAWSGIAIHLPHQPASCSPATPSPMSDTVMLGTFNQDRRRPRSHRLQATGRVWMPRRLASATASPSHRRARMAGSATRLAGHTRRGDVLRARGHRA